MTMKTCHAWNTAASTRHGYGDSTALPADCRRTGRGDFFFDW
jgi:hypothetical protein